MMTFPHEIVRIVNRDRGMRKTDHLTEMIDDRITKQEIRNGGRHFRPRIMLNDHSREHRCGRKIRRPLLRNAQMNMRDSDRRNFERLPLERRFRID